MTKLWKQQNTKTNHIIITIFKWENSKFKKKKKLLKIDLELDTRVYPTDSLWQKKNLLNVNYAESNSQFIYLHINKVLVIQN